MKSSNLGRLFAIVMALLLLSLSLGGCAAQSPGAETSKNQTSSELDQTEQETQPNQPETTPTEPTEPAEPAEPSEPTEPAAPTAPTGNGGGSGNETQVTKPDTETTKPPQEPTEPPAEPSLVCYITIDCKTILPRMGDLTPGKESFVPQDGYILGKTKVTFTEGETVFDVLLRVTREQGIHMEYEFFPIYESQYIEGINQLYEFDCGSGSGWMYYVNGTKPNYGVSKYTLENGDNIQIRYTCDLGNDL